MVTFRPVLAGALLLALALFAGASLSPAAVQAQTPPPGFNSSGVLTTATATITIGDVHPFWRCIPVSYSFNIYAAAGDKLCFAMYNSKFTVLVYPIKMFPDILRETGQSNDIDLKMTIEVFTSDNTKLLGIGTSSSSIRWSSGIASPWNESGFIKSPSFGQISDLTVGASAYVVFTLYDSESYIVASDKDADIPAAPEIGTISRNDASTEATINWVLQGPVVEYQIERQTASSVFSDNLARIEYGNAKRFLVSGQFWGVDSFTDTPIEPDKSYRYRMRARRGVNKWGGWSGYATTFGTNLSDLEAPANVQLSRAHDNSEITVSWNAPSGDFDNLTVQRQELVSAEGSTLFANLRTLSGADCGTTEDTWLPATAVVCTDSGILPERTYEYRVAAVKNGEPGNYSNWARSSAVSRSLGGAPRNLRLVEDATDRVLADRREFWMRWDPVQGADDYEVEVRTFDASGNGSTESLLYTDPRFFRTAYGRTELRVRGSQASDTICGNDDGTLAAGEVCHTDWTPWYEVLFSPRPAAAAARPTPTPDASIEEFRAKVHQLMDETLDETGADVSNEIALQFASLVGTVAICSVSVAVGWRRQDMRPLAVGMAFSVSVVSMYTASHLFGIPEAWAIGIQSIVMLLGSVAFARQLGAFR